MIEIDRTIQPADLSDKLERMWRLSGRKILSIEQTCTTETGTPVFTIGGRYTAQGWTEWTQGFRFGSAILQFDATGNQQFLDIGRENRALEDQFKQAIAEVYQSGRFVLGPDCVRLEERMAQLCGATDGIGCASGSEALLLSLMAIDVGPSSSNIRSAARRSDPRSVTSMPVVSATWSNANPRPQNDTHDRS